MDDFEALENIEKWTDIEDKDNNIEDCTVGRLKIGG